MSPTLGSKRDIDPDRDKDPAFYPDMVPDPKFVPKRDQDLVLDFLYISGSST